MERACRTLEDQTSKQQVAESGFTAAAINNLRKLQRTRKRVIYEETDVTNFLKIPGPRGPVGLRGVSGLPGLDGAMGYMGHMGLIGNGGLRGPDGREGREGRLGPTGL